MISAHYTVSPLQVLYHGDSCSGFLASFYLKRSLCYLLPQKQTMPNTKSLIGMQGGRMNVDANLINRLIHPISIYRPQHVRPQYDPSSNLKYRLSTNDLHYMRANTLRVTIACSKPSVTFGACETSALVGTE